MKGETPYSNFKKMLYAIFGLNALDAIATLTWIDLGLAQEGNPLMAPLIACCPLRFVVIKMGIVVGVCCYLCIEIKNDYTLIAGKIVFAAYTLLAVWHMVGFYKMFQLFS